MPTISRPVRRGQIWWLDWSPGRGSEQLGRRPGLIVQADEGNDSRGATTIILSLTSSGPESELRILVEPTPLNGLSKTGFIKCDQLQTIDKLRLDGYIGIIEPRIMKLVDEALLQILALERP